MIKSLSPYYITIPMVAPLSGLTCTEFTVEIRIWDGEKTAVPTTANYSITKSNATASTGNDYINIAPMSNSLITFTKQEGSGTELINGSNQLWLKYNTYYTTSNANDALVPSNVNTILLVKGYGYGMDGQNPDTPANLHMYTNNEFRVARDGYFVAPIEIPETAPAAATITIDSITLFSGVQYTVAYSTTGTVTDVTAQIRLQPATDWESPVFTNDRVTLDAFGTWDVRMRAYDTVYGNFIYSSVETQVVS